MKNERTSNIYNKFYHNPNGTLIGNWYEEQCLRNDTGEGRAVIPHHIPKKFMDFDNVYKETTKVDNTFQRIFWNRNFGEYSTEYQTYGDFKKYEVQNKKLTLKEKMYNDFMNNYKGIREESTPEPEKTNDEEEIQRRKFEEKLMKGADGFKKKIVEFCVNHGWVALRNMKDYFKKCSQRHDCFVPGHQFKIFMLNYGIYLDDYEMNFVLFRFQNGKKDVDYETLLNGVVECSDERFVKIESLINEIFGTFDKFNEGKLKFSDAKKLFNYKIHPEYLSGKKNAGEIQKDFADLFVPKEILSKEEFKTRLIEISTCVPDETDFETILKCIGYQ